MSVRGGRARIACPPLLAFAVALLLAAGCGGRTSTTRLMDGTRPGPLGVDLEGLRARIVLTSVRAVPARDVARPRLGSCVSLFRPLRLSPDDLVVQRVGVEGESVTFRDAAGRFVAGCDSSLGRRDGGRVWCGAPAGKLLGGRLADPRLSLGCRTRGGALLGFAWVTPEPAARFIAVDEPGYTEVYETAGRLPVRIVTERGVDPRQAAASFALAEYDARGRMLAQLELKPVVAG